MNYTALGWAFLCGVYFVLAPWKFAGKKYFWAITDTLICVACGYLALTFR